MTDQFAPSNTLESRMKIAREIAFARASDLQENTKGSDINKGNKPMVMKPLLGLSPAELARHRSENHIRVAHGISNIGAYATGAIDGVVDLLANGAGEIIEDTVFFISKVVHGAQHGWKRGKFPNGNDQ
jgi:hypothetical protein